MHRGGCAVAMLTGPLFLGVYQKWGLSFVQNAVVETVTLSLPRSFGTKHRHSWFVSFRWLLPAISACSSRRRSTSILRLLVRLLGEGVAKRKGEC